MWTTVGSGQLVLQDDPDLVALGGAEQRPGHGAVVGPGLDEFARRDLPLDDAGGDLEHLDAVDELRLEELVALRGRRHLIGMRDAVSAARRGRLGAWAAAGRGLRGRGRGRRLRLAGAPGRAAGLRATFGPPTPIVALGTRTMPPKIDQTRPPVQTAPITISAMNIPRIARLHLYKDRSRIQVGPLGAAVTAAPF